MVLGLRLIAPLAAGLMALSPAVLLAGCSAGKAADDGQSLATTTVHAVPDDRLSEARVGGRALRLVTQAGQCALVVGAGVGAAPVPLGLAAPCGFLRAKAGAAAWTHDYGTRGSVVLVGGPPDPPAADSGRTVYDRCSDTGRAVIVLGGKLALSEVKRSPAWFCPDAAPDEKYYYGIAHERPFAARATVG